MRLGNSFVNISFANRQLPRSLKSQLSPIKVLYAGYFPMGLSLERIFTDLPDVPFKDTVAENLYGSAARILGLEG
jgi:hypothetical protein